MKTKRLLCPQRLRTVPHQFSWIDQRLVREGHNRTLWRNPSPSALPPVSYRR